MPPPGPSCRPGSASLAPAPAPGPHPRPLLREALGARAGGAAGRLWAGCGPRGRTPRRTERAPWCTGGASASCGGNLGAAGVSGLRLRSLCRYVVRRALGKGEATFLPPWFRNASVVTSSVRLFLSSGFGPFGNGENSLLPACGEGEGSEAQRAREKLKGRLRGEARRGEFAVKGRVLVFSPKERSVWTVPPPSS